LCRPTDGGTLLRRLPKNRKSRRREGGPVLLFLWNLRGKSGTPESFALSELQRKEDAPPSHPYVAKRSEREVISFNPSRCRRGTFYLLFRLSGGGGGAGGGKESIMRYLRVKRGRKCFCIKNRELLGLKKRRGESSSGAQCLGGKEERYFRIVKGGARLIRVPPPQRKRESSAPSTSKERKKREDKFLPSAERGEGAFPLS